VTEATTTLTRAALYGVKNWLVVFAIGVLLGGLRELGTLNGEAHEAGITIIELLAIDHPAAHYAKISLSLNAAFILVVFWLLLTKNPKFRPIASGLLLASWPLGALVGTAFPYQGLGSALTASLLPWLLSCAVRVTYLNRSRRVRVTFEQMTIDGESGSTEKSATLADINGATVLPDRRPTSNSGLAPQPSTGNAASSSVNDTKSTAFDDELWAKSLTEFESDTRNRGLWARCFAEASGNEAIAKARYLSERTSQFQIAEEKAILQQKLKEAAQLEKRKLEQSVDPNQIDLLHCIQFIRLNGTKTPVGVFKNLLRLLGGKFEWNRTSGLNMGWQVSLKEHSLILRNDIELSKWVLETALPMAESDFQGLPDTSPVGNCPSCDATIPLSSIRCLGCPAVFGVGSAWNPIPRGEA